MSNERPETVEPVTRIAYLVRMLSNTLTPQIERALRPAALTQAQLAALAQLAFSEQGWLSGAELGRRAGVTAQSMSTALAELERRALIERSAHPNQRRINRVSITEAGRELLERAQALTKPVDTRALSLLTDAQRTQFRELLMLALTGAGGDAATAADRGQVG